MKRVLPVAGVLGAVVLGSAAVLAQDVHFDRMSFFVTSEGLGKGGDLGGLEGADAHCQTLAEAVGAGDRVWRAYLSTESEAGGPRGINARDRIGEGPWYNKVGVMIAADVNQLHLNPNLTKWTALNEKGQAINGFGDNPNRHDMLTGSQEDGTAYFADDMDHTCNNWTSSDEGSAQLGHSDRTGGGRQSWNSAHPSRGCSQQGLISTGGDGLFYCFAAD